MVFNMLKKKLEKKKSAKFSIHVCSEFDDCVFLVLGVRNCLHIHIFATHKLFLFVYMAYVTDRVKWFIWRFEGSSFTFIL